MKRAISFMFVLLLVCMSGCLASAAGIIYSQTELESAGETFDDEETEIEKSGNADTGKAMSDNAKTEEEMFNDAETEEGTADNDKTVSLRFSSFSGGGYEYTVEADDPSVIRCDSLYEYEPHAEEIDGASFDFIVTVTGVKPGRTTLKIYGRSPILENEDTIYDVIVDEELNVTLFPVRAISTFFEYRYGEIAFDSYQITMDEEGYYLSVNEEPEQPVSADLVSGLMDVIEKYDVASWDGFNESKPFVLDGESFWLDYTLTDGTRVHASGDNVFPEHYFDAMGEMWEVLIEMTEEESTEEEGTEV